MKMFRHGKSTESKTKNPNKVDRYEEMIKQQQLIETKKQEIQARIEERKRQEADGARKKLPGETVSGKKTDAKLLNSKLRSWKSDDRWRKKTNQKHASATESGISSNDGSFFDKYKKSVEKDDKTNEPSSVKNKQHKESSADRDNWDFEQLSKLEKNDSRNVRISHFEDKESVSSMSSFNASGSHLPRTRTIDPKALQETPTHNTFSQDTVHQAPSATSYPCSISSSTLPIFNIPSMPPGIVHPPMPPFIPNFSPYPPTGNTQFHAHVAPPMLSSNSRFVRPTPSYNKFSVPPPVNADPYSGIPPASTIHFGNADQFNVAPDTSYLDNGRSLQSVKSSFTQEARQITGSKEVDKDEYENERVFEGSDISQKEEHEHDVEPNGNRLNDECMEEIADIVAGSSDEIEEIILKDNVDNELFWFLKDKQSKAYAKFREIVEKKRNIIFEKKNKEKVEPVIEEKVVDETKEEKEEEREDPADNKRKKRKKRSRWDTEDASAEKIISNVVPGLAVPSALGQVVQVTRSVNLTGGDKRNNPALMQYALKSFGTVNLSEEDWKKAEDHYKINLLYQDMLKKRQEIEKLQAAGKFKYEYDSDEDTDGGTWEHKLRMQEMTATQLWADELTEKAQGKHHIGDFLPPDELERFMEKYNSLKQGREPDLSDYKEFKLKEDNIGFQMLQKLGWSEGQGLGVGGAGIVNPVNKGATHMEPHGLGVDKPAEVTGNEDEYDAYRKRMMLAYRFRPNPLNNPRRPYY